MIPGAQKKREASMREDPAAKTKSNRSEDAGRRRFCQTACVSGFAAAGGLATFVLTTPQRAQGVTMGRNAGASDAELPAGAAAAQERGDTDEQRIADLVSGNHILFDQGVLDGF